ncbi:hypothetical protein [Nocardiopsis potens]|uniref:hypothetical protein n=1 Tax=Nocardiopsis potens TaxID=1246458 RepID=UPI00034592F7|nr:hypothetical protein [Nocardiopsis potens]
MDLSHSPTGRTGRTGAALDPRVRAVLTAPRGHRFSRSRRYTRPRPATAPDRPAVLRATASPRAPPWLARLHAELAPDGHGTGPAPRSAPSPAAPAPRTGGAAPGSPTARPPPTPAPS